MYNDPVCCVLCPVLASMIISRGEFSYRVSRVVIVVTDVQPSVEVVTGVDIEK